MNVVDGGGNDSYMGYLMPQKEIRHTDYAFAQYLPWIWGASEGIGESEKWINIQRVLMKYPAEIIFPAGGLSVSAIRNLTDGRVHMREIFEGLKNKYKKLSAIDYRGYVRGRLYDSPCISGKVRTSASAHKCNVVYPFCDSDFIEYYYNLPAELKYEYEPDSDVLVNKVALREFCEGNLPHSLLKYVVDNKGFFKFDPVEFVNANLDLIKEEVVRSAPYFRNVDNLWGFLEARRHNIFFAYEIYTLSCVVAWLNRRPSDVGIDLSGQNDEQEMIFAF